MSYCRFSAESEVYVFEDVSGKWKTWLATHRLVPIGLPHDGEHFDDDSPGWCADRLERLKSLGYMVPQDAIDWLREDQEKLKTQETP